MTQAFNLSQLANGVNTSGQLNAASYLYNQVPVANGGTGLSTLTAGYIPYGAGTAAFGSSINFVWDSVNSRLGIGTATPAVKLSISGTDAVLIPVGTTAQRPTGATGYLRFNTTTTQFEGFNGAVWGSIGSSITSATAQTSITGTSIDFTGIPSTAKRITVLLVGVSMAAAGAVRIRVGTSAGLVTTGYAGGTLTFPAGGSITAASLGTAPEGIGAFSTTDGTTIVHGSFVITNVTGNTWSSSGTVYRTNDSNGSMSNGNIALGGVLDRVSIVATTSSFDAGTINIIYE